MGRLTLKLGCMYKKKSSVSEPDSFGESHVINDLKLWSYIAALTPDPKIYEDVNQHNVWYVLLANVHKIQRTSKWHVASRFRVYQLILNNFTTSKNKKIKTLCAYVTVLQYNWLIT